MSSLAEKVSAAGLTDHIFNERRLGEALGGGDARRYVLVNRALKDGSLVRVKRGTYVLGQQYRSEPFHPFAIAQGLVPASYVSLESALAHHGWIPEAVFVTASITPGRKTLRYETPDFGAFGFHPLAIRDYGFLAQIDSVRLGKRTAFVAQPLRALMDLVALRKQRWTGMEWLVEGLRIDERKLRELQAADFLKLQHVYKHKAVNIFLKTFEAALIGGKKHLSERTII